MEFTGASPTRPRFISHVCEKWPNFIKRSKPSANLIRLLTLSFPQEGQADAASTTRYGRPVKRGLVRAGADMLTRHATVAPHLFCHPCRKLAVTQHRCW